MPCSKRSRMSAAKVKRSIQRGPTIGYVWGCFRINHWSNWINYFHLAGELIECSATEIIKPQSSSKSWIDALLVDGILASVSMLKNKRIEELKETKNLRKKTIFCDDEFSEDKKYFGSDNGDDSVIRRTTTCTFQTLVSREFNLQIFSHYRKHKICWKTVLKNFDSSWTHLRRFLLALIL